MIGRPINILLVEDDEAHAEIVRRNLATNRVANRIHHVADGQAALDFLHQQEAFAEPADAPRPDLVLLDLRLPKVDGLDVLRHIKADPALQAIPVVILTTSNTEREMATAYRHGAGSYLVKPIDFEQFARLMETFGFYWLAWNQFPLGSGPTR